MSSKTTPQKQSKPHVRAVSRLLTITAGAFVGVCVWQCAPFFLSLVSPPPQKPLSQPELIVPLQHSLSTPSISPSSPHPTPLSLYAQPFTLPTAEKKQVVYIVFNIGEDPHLTQRALENLPKETAIAISPLAQDASYWAQEFHQKGHEILVTVGLEPEGYPLNDPGANTLLTGLTGQDMEERLTESLRKVPYALGITHETGSLFTTQDQPLRTLLKILTQKGLCFLDPVVTPQTLSPQIASEEKTSVLTVDRPLSLHTLTKETLLNLKEQAFQQERLVVSLPLSEKSLQLISQTPCEETPAPTGKKKTIPGITLVPLSFALK